MNLVQIKKNTLMTPVQIENNSLMNPVQIENTINYTQKELRKEIGKSEEQKIRKAIDFGLGNYN